MRPPEETAAVAQVSPNIFTGIPGLLHVFAFLSNYFVLAKLSVNKLAKALMKSKSKQV